MKTILFFIAINCALLSQGQAFAQESAATDDAAKQDSFKITVNRDIEVGEKSAEQKINRAVETVRKLAGDKVGDELALELNGLSDDEKEELVEEFEDGFNNINVSGLGFGEMVVAIVGIVFTLGMPIIIVLMGLIFAHRKRRQKMEVMRVYIESGREVPDHVLAEFSGEDTNNFRSGVKLIAIGLGVCLALMLSGNEDVAAFGLIPLFIGGARLIFWKYDNKADQA